MAGQGSEGPAELLGLSDFLNSPSLGSRDGTSIPVALEGQRPGRPAWLLCREMGPAVPIEM